MNLRLVLLATLCLACLASAGCLFERDERQHAVMSHTTSSQAAEAGRVAVMPFFIADGVGRAAGIMGDSMAAGLRELGLHEVVLVTPDQRDRLLTQDVVLANRMRAADLLIIRDALRVDAVLLGRVEQFDSYDPISLGLTCSLVSCRDGEVLWSATGHFDGHRQDIQDEVRRWYEKTLSSESNPISGWKVVLQSPKLFTRYVADRLAQSIPVKKKAE
jgi:hypothetical protein